MHKKILSICFNYSDDEAYSKRVFWLLIIFASALTFIMFTKMTLAISNGSGFNHVAGAWTAMAQDLNKGIFYRPLFSEETGFGGTRFFPLYFSLHALLIKLTGMPLLSGHILSLFSGGLLIVGFYFLLRKSSVSKMLSMVFVVLLLSPISMQHGFETIRGDILPLALNIIGLFFFLSRLPNRYREVLASICFVLAFSAKVTSVTGVVALCFWLILNGRKNEAIRIILFTLAGYIVFFTGIYYASSGRVFDIFAACASGGTTRREILRAPLVFIDDIFSNGKLVVLFLFWGIFIFFNNGRNLLKNLSTSFFAVSLSIIVVLYASPGIASNHLVDVTAGSLWFIAESSRLQQSNIRRGIIYMAALVISIAILLNLAEMSAEISNAKEAERSYPVELVQRIKDSEGTILSEDPFLPIMANKFPYVLDSFMLRMISRNRKELGDVFLNKVKDQQFSMIIFIFNPTTKNKWYSTMHFGAKNIKAIMQNYKESKRYGRFFVYVPKTKTPQIN